MRMDQPDYPLYLTAAERRQPGLLSRPSPVSATSPQGIPPRFHPSELSPDGSRILGYYTDDQGRQRLAVIPADGRGAVQKLDVTLQMGETAKSHAWAPEGRAITVVKVADGVSTLWRHPLDGAPAARLAVYPPGEAVALHAWSRDGKRLALVRSSPDRQVVMMREREAANGR